MRRAWNDTSTVYERESSVDEVFSTRANETPDAIAVECSDRSLTYRELGDASERVAGRICSSIEQVVAAGAEPYIAVLAERSIEAVAGFLGILRAGAAYVPLDPDFPRERLRMIVEDSGACAVLTQSHLAERAGGLTNVDLMTIEDAMACPVQRPVDARPSKSGPTSPIYMMYTSGSTGRPKGVVVEHRGVLRYVRGANGLLPRPSDRVLLVGQLGFDSTTYEIWAALTNGSRLVIHRPGRPEPGEVADTVQKASVNVAFFATAVFHQMVEGALSRLCGLRLVLVGGDVLSPVHAQRFVEAHPDCRLVNAYGPTETTVSASFYEVGRIDAGRSVPIGRPLANTTLYVLDEQGRLVPDGESGELYIGGDGVARGYANLPELTSERFVPDPFAEHPGRRLYRSGDQVRVRSDGELEFLGRLDDQVKVRGYRVEPGEVEAVLSSHQEVMQAVVVAREDIPGHKRLVAYATIEGAVDADQLRRFLEDRLPEYMVPSAIVVLDAMPVTATGKVDRAALPAPSGSLAPRGQRRPTATEAERAVAAAWSEVLGIEDVRADDDFFESGGDSLLALALLSRLRDQLGVELPIAAVFEDRSLSAIAARAERARSRSAHGAALLPPIESSSDGGPIPVSVAQEQVLFLGDLAEDSLPYQSQAVIWLEGRLDHISLERALSSLIARHEILRTTFRRADDTWVLQVQPPADARLSFVDVSAESDPDEAVSALLKNEFSQRIDVSNSLPVRWVLVRVSEARHALVQIEHHAVHDGVSSANLLSEWLTLYRAFVEGRPNPLSPPVVQYRDFAQWQRAFPSTPEGRAQLQYWVGRLRDAPEPPELASDHPRPFTFTFRGASIRAPIDEDVFEQLRALGARLGCTPFMVMAGAFFAFLYRYSGQTDAVIGSGLANRRVAGTESLLGMAVNTVVLRANLEGDPTIEELLVRVREVCLEALSAQEIPFEEVVTELGPERHGGPSPFYRHIFSFHDSPFPDLELPHLKVTPQDALSNGSAKADLNVVVVNRRRRQRARADGVVTGSDAGRLGAIEEAGVTLVWEFCTDIFDESAARRMVAHYIDLLSQIVADPRRTISGLRLATADERLSLLSAARNERVYERDSSICEVFAERVRENPAALAVTSGDTQLSYSQLEEKSDLLARRLLALGVGWGSRVAVVDDRSPAMVVALVGILKAGAAYVGLDASLSARRLDNLIETAGITTLCTSEAGTLSPAIERLSGRSVSIVCVDDKDDDALLYAGRGVLMNSPRVGAEDLAYVCFTSGSTGEQKGVEVIHRGVVRLVRGADYLDFGPAERLLGMAPLSFDASTLEIWGALLNGARLVLAPPGPLSTDEIAEVISDHGVTIAWLTSAVFHQMVDYELDALCRVRQIIAGGDVLSPAHVNQVLRVLPVGGALVNGYGPTESTTFACCHRMVHGTEINGSVPIGKPIANTSVYVLDVSGAPAPVGVPGELFIGGDGLARGYLGRPELTAERFVPDPFSGDADARLYRTGDLARWSENGVIEFLGRIDRQLKIRGYRVEPAEVEAALIRHTAVEEAVVVAREWGPDDKRLVAYLLRRPVPRSSRPGQDECDKGGSRYEDRPTGDELRGFLSDLLPRYMVPSAYVWLEQFPLTPGGKVDTARLPEPQNTWAPADPANEGKRDPSDASSWSTFASAPGAYRLELKLMTLWQEVLGVRPIGLSDNFFDLGGHSLLAVALFAEIEREIGARLPLATIFEAPTVERLASVLQRGGWDASWGSLVPLTTTGSRSPIFCVTAGDGNAVGFGPLARRLGPDQPFYALQPRGLDGRVLYHHRVETMAVHYVHQVRSVQGHGPYVLGGRCFGTLVAYEMARRLEAAGEKVALLIALDSVGPFWTTRLLANGMPYDEVMNLARVQCDPVGTRFARIFADASAADKFVEWLREPVSESGDCVVNRYLRTAYSAREDLQVAFPLENGGHAGLCYWSWVGGRSEMGMNAALLPSPSKEALRARPSVDPRHGSRFERARAFAIDCVDVATRGRVPRLVARRQGRLLEIATRTILQYRGGPCAVPVALIRSAEYRDDPQLARWFGLATGGVEEHYVAGTHRSMVREPDVASLASAVERLVDGAISSSADVSIRIE